MSCTDAPRRRLSSMAAVAAGLVAAGLLPWTAWLAMSLPGTATAAHWTTAWVGLDLAITTAATTSCVLLARRHPRADLALTACAALMLADAWFDTTTAAGPDVSYAMIEAGLVELPLAAAALVVALRLRPPPQPDRTAGRVPTASGIRHDRPAEWVGCR